MISLINTIKRYKKNCKDECRESVRFIHILSGVALTFVPMQDFTQEWTDEKLYKKYGLTQEEIDFIEFMIKPME